MKYTLYCSADFKPVANVYNLERGEWVTATCHASHYENNAETHHKLDMEAQRYKAQQLELQLRDDNGKIIFTTKGFSRELTK